jgi:hypothetical protein
LLLVAQKSTCKRAGSSQNLKSDLKTKKKKKKKNLKITITTLQKKTENQN